MSSAPPNTLAPLLFVCYNGEKYLWKSLYDLLRSVEITGKNEFFFCFIENSLFRLIGSSLERAGLDNNNSFYCPSTSGGAPASCCAVSLNFNLWRETKRERGRRPGWRRERLVSRPPSCHTYGELEKIFVKETRRSLEIFSRLFDWFEISGGQLKSASNVVLKDN